LDEDLAGIKVGQDLGDVNEEFDPMDNQSEDENNIIEKEANKSEGENEKHSSQGSEESDTEKKKVESTFVKKKIKKDIQKVKKAKKPKQKRMAKVTESLTGVEVEKDPDSNKMLRIIVWLKNELRLHDNPLLYHAVEQQHEVIDIEIVPVFCYDPRVFN
jgi:hypothetical protein